MVALDLVRYHLHDSQPGELALRFATRSTVDCFPAVQRRPRAGASRLLDFPGRANRSETVVGHYPGAHRPGYRGQTGSANRRETMRALPLVLILCALTAFVTGQLLFKHAMETSHRGFDRNFAKFFVPAIACMTISFFLTLGLLQRF